MSNENISQEYTRRIDKVVNYILSHMNEELNLAVLARIANYSPFHFQRLFKELIGESPKQFIIRMRLENAAFLIITHRHKSIGEIAENSGFSSVSTFARAFKNYFGVTAQQLRELPRSEQFSIHKKFHYSSKLSTFSDSIYRTESMDGLDLKIVTIPNLFVAFINGPLDDTFEIQNNFRKIVQLALEYNFFNSDSMYIGVISPHARLYQAGVSFLQNKEVPKSINTAKIEAGKYAVLKVSGDIKQNFLKFHNFYDNWLPRSIYRIKEHSVFEVLTRNPITMVYETTIRDLYIPIEPK